MFSLTNRLENSRFLILPAGDNTRLSLPCIFFLLFRGFTIQLALEHACSSNVRMR
jgi:hypothetical protein